MIFPTLEGLSVHEQEEYELAQLRARGMSVERHPMASRRGGARVPSGPRMNSVSARLLAHMRPGVEYSASDLMRACNCAYGQIVQVVDLGYLVRSGTRMQYRYRRAA